MLVMCALPLVGGMGWWVLSWLRRTGFEVDAVLEGVRGPDVSGVPVELARAVWMLGSDQNAQRVWVSLGLGTFERGCPIVMDWIYTDMGMDIEVAMLTGQAPTDWQSDDMRTRLAHALGVPEVRVTSKTRGFVMLSLRTSDPLARPIPLPRHQHDNIDLRAVIAGMTEDGQWWSIKILYAHVLLAGVTGAGKGSVLWSIIAGLAPAVRQGLVDLWVADPKGGVEFFSGADLFTRFTWDPAQIIAMMTEAVELMDHRKSQMRGQRSRKHIPTALEPLIVIIIDEAAALSAYATADEKKEFTRLLGILLTQGRAMSISVIAALQDPSKETMPQRQLFPARIGLRLDEPTQVTMIHGKGARDRGAACDQISDEMQGVGYVSIDGVADFVRVRAFWVDDHDIDALVDQYAPLPAPVDLEEIRRMSA